MKNIIFLLAVNPKDISISGVFNFANNLHNVLGNVKIALPNNVIGISKIRCAKENSPVTTVLKNVVKRIIGTCLDAVLSNPDQEFIKGNFL